MNKFFFVAYFFVFQVAHAQVVSLQSLLNDIADESSVARWPKPAFSMREASSYDRRSVSPSLPGWNADDDYSQYICSEVNDGHKEYVMLDVDGPGAVVRFWITTSSTKGGGTMRFYFDGEKRPSLTSPAYDLMEAGLRLGPALLGTNLRPDWVGNTLYLPLPFQRHCKITWEETDTSTREKRYYQIDYRKYPVGTTVETFSSVDLERARFLIDKIETALWNHPEPRAVKTVAAKKKLKPGEELTLTLPQGSFAIRKLQLSLQPIKASDFDTVAKQTILQVKFDEAVTVDCPVDDFSGSGRGMPRLRSWYQDVDDNHNLTSRWIMPYKNGGEVKIINKSSVNATLSVSADLLPWRWDERSMYFHASWKQQLNVRDVKWDYPVSRVPGSDSLAPLDWNLATIKGRGVYFGNSLDICNHMHKWFGEGDHKVWVDNDTFPSEFGTGLEDYYNSPYLAPAPLANLPRLNFTDFSGYNVFVRTHILDAIPFSRQMRFDMEMIGGAAGYVDLRAANYWYSLGGVHTE